MATIELAAYVEALREEVQRCLENGKGKELQFATDTIDLEIEVGIETAVGATGEAKFRFLVFDATLGGDGKRTFTNTQTIKMTLKPVYRGKSGPLMISSETAKRGDC